jgi:hypothetical protein
MEVVKMELKKWLEEIKKLPPEEQKRMKQELKEILKELKVPRAKKEIPEEAQRLIDEYWEAKEKVLQIRKRLYEEFGLTPTGVSVRQGYGSYDYRGTPAYEAVKEIIKSHGVISIENLEKELQAKGYKGITGTIGVVLKNLREDGLIERRGGEYVWTGEREST